MSADDEFVAEAQLTMSCASCGKSELNDIELKPCDACDLVNYCSDACHENHRLEHETKCKERAAKLREEILFRQPESSYLGDCPICCVPLPIEEDKRRLYSCCGKMICDGCAYANKMHQLRENIPQTCPFCRQPLPESEEECSKIMMQRIAANNPNALTEMGNAHWKEGDYDRAFKYWTKAAALGDVNAHCKVAVLYQDGQGVEKDESKEAYHLEEAAIRGHVLARQSLGVYEERNGRIERAVKHLIIAANLGHENAMKTLKECYKDGDVSKEDFAAALLAHHAAVTAMKSPQREEAANF